MFIGLFLFMKEISSNLVAQNALQKIWTVIYSNHSKAPLIKRWDCDRKYSRGNVDTPNISFIVIPLIQWMSSDNINSYL